MPRRDGIGEGDDIGGCNSKRDLRLGWDTKFGTDGRVGCAAMTGVTISFVTDFVEHEGKIFMECCIGASELTGFESREAVATDEVSTEGDSILDS